MAKRMTSDKLIKAMDIMGYYFDPIESYSGALRFTTDSGTVCYFESWKAVSEWLQFVVAD